MPRLESIYLGGYKSFGQCQEINFGNVTVLLGANGAGKSNVISLFRMLNHMVTGGLQSYVSKNGMAHSLLHFGAERTREIFLEACFTSEAWRGIYKAVLAFGMPDTLFMEHEYLAVEEGAKSTQMENSLVASGRGESFLGTEVPSKDMNPSQVDCWRRMKSLLSGIRTFQFHDTSETSRLRRASYVESGAYLMGDAGNLPAFLYAMKANNPRYYQRIVEHIKLMVPQFRDFHLRPSSNNENFIFLNWVGEQGDQYLFGPHQLSDGSLRYMALASLLLQPKKNIPDVIVLDEPELGLHPAAIVSLAEMISVAQRNCQVILATQSPLLANQFSVGDIVIVDYDNVQNETVLKRLDPDALKGWLDNYTIEELWEKNVLGGRP